jgi:hypothetical protein
LHPFHHTSPLSSPLPLPRCSFNTFIFKFFMVTDYNEVLPIGHTYTEQKANFHTPCLSVSITVSVPYLWLHNYPIHCIFVVNSTK